MTTAVAPPEAPDRWRFRQGDEIHPGRTALKLLGGGRRYEAYLASDDTLLTTVVVKVLRPSRTADDSALRGLAEEYDTLRSLNHPSICRAFDAVLDGERPHIVLEHIEGPRLSTLIRKYGRVDLDQLVPLAVQLCSALHYMHGRDMVHLDVKPQNVIMGAPPRLIDLSVACSAQDARRLRSPVGTDAYMAPEQCDPTGPVPVGTPSDIWGVGVTLYEAMTGALPFPRGEEAHPQQTMAPAPLPRTVPADLAAVVEDCLARDPAHRPTAAQLADALEPFVAGLPREIVLNRLRPRWR
jgi:eukaryotic-like serine/threonine-protein kinase